MGVLQARSKAIVEPGHPDASGDRAVRVRESAHFWTLSSAGALCHITKREEKSLTRFGVKSPISTNGYSACENVTHPYSEILPCKCYIACHGRDRIQTYPHASHYSLEKKRFNNYINSNRRFSWHPLLFIVEKRSSQADLPAY
jgi:hypothetical protein